MNGRVEHIHIYKRSVTLLPQQSFDTEEGVDIEQANA